MADVAALVATQHLYTYHLDAELLYMDVWAGTCEGKLPSSSLQSSVARRAGVIQAQRRHMLLSDRVRFYSGGTQMPLEVGVTTFPDESVRTPNNLLTSIHHWPVETRSGADSLPRLTSFLQAFSCRSRFLLFPISSHRLRGLSLLKLLFKQYQSFFPLLNHSSSCHLRLQENSSFYFKVAS